MGITGKLSTEQPAKDGFDPGDAFAIQTIDEDGKFERSSV